MRLIRDTDFKRNLARYYFEFEDDSQFHPEYRQKEHAAEEALLGFLPMVERVEFSRTGSLEQTEIDPASTIEELRRRPDVIERLEDMVWVQDRMETRYSWVIEASNDMLADIQTMR